MKDAILVCVGATVIFGAFITVLMFVKQIDNFMIHHLALSGWILVIGSLGIGGYWIRQKIRNS